jgi:lysozyme family protein
MEVVVDPKFQAAVSYVIQNEGTEYTNDPDDAGGPTKFGITLEDLIRWRKKPCTPDDVRNLTQDEAEQIYEAFYWNPMGLGQVSRPGIATAIMDCGVLDGIVTGARWAQVAVGVQADGHIGPQTIAALNSIDTGPFLAKFIPQVQDHYIDIVLAKPSQFKYLKGWVARSQRLLTLIG